jgi:hypothetical protein
MTLTDLLRGTSLTWASAVTGLSVESPRPPGGPVTGAAPVHGEGAGTAST